MIHHLISPDEDVSLFYNFGNLVALCDAHHNPAIAGEDPRAPREYAPTVGPLPGMSNPHPRPTQEDYVARVIRLSNQQG